MDAYILTGGLSSRMGYPKSELIFRGKKFSEIIANKLDKVGFKNIYTIGCNELYWADFPDKLNRGSSLTGIITVLLNARENYNAIFSCDSPILDNELLIKLTSDKKFVGIKNNRINPFPAIYCKEDLNIFIKEYDRNNFRIIDIIKKLNYNYFDLDKYQNIININSKSDFYRIKRIRRNYD